MSYNKVQYDDQFMLNDASTVALSPPVVKDKSSSTKQLTNHFTWSFEKMDEEVKSEISFEDMDEISPKSQISSADRSEHTQTNSDLRNIDFDKLTIANWYMEDEIRNDLGPKSTNFANGIRLSEKENELYAEDFDIESMNERKPSEIECANSPQGVMDIQMSFPSSNSLGKRRDIVFKTLLRKIKKDYKADFYGFTQYDKTKRMKSPLHFYKCLKQYIDEIFNSRDQKLSESEQDELIFNLGCLLSKNDMVKLLKYPCFKKFGEERSVIQAKISHVSKVHSTLYKFSIARLNEIINKGFAKLFLKYADVHKYKMMSEPESELYYEICQNCNRVLE